MHSTNCLLKLAKQPRSGIFREGRWRNVISVCHAMPKMQLCLISFSLSRAQKEAQSPVVCRLPLQYWAPGAPVDAAAGHWLEVALLEQGLDLMAPSFYLKSHQLNAGGSAAPTMVAVHPCKDLSWWCCIAVWCSPRSCGAVGAVGLERSWRVVSQCPELVMGQEQEPEPSLSHSLWLVGILKACAWLEL